jgi:hypothetical protein
MEIFGEISTLLSESSQAASQMKSSARALAAPAEPAH